MKLYKLTKQDGTTHDGYKYGIIGKIHKKEEKHNPRLCSSDVFHAYKNINLAFLLNSNHANINNPVLWEIEGDICCEDFGKVGSFQQKVIGKINYPKWVNSDRDNKVRVLFAILCAESVYPLWEKYNGKDKRVLEAILAAREYLKNPSSAAAAAAAAAYAAAAAAAYAYAAAAAYAAAYAAAAAYAYAADADAAAAAAAADAAYAYAAYEIDFCELADRSVIENGFT